VHVGCLARSEKVIETRCRVAKTNWYFFLPHLSLGSRSCWRGVRCGTRLRRARTQRAAEAKKLGHRSLSSVFRHTGREASFAGGTMKSVIFAVIALLGMGAAQAQYQGAPPSLPPSASSVQLIEQGYYTNSSGQLVHRPAHSVNNQVPRGATAQCRDGSFSFSLHHRGTCSHHGGVVRWL